MCDQCDWEDKVNEMEEMCDDPTYDFCLDTIESMLDRIETNQHITKKQIEAVENIKAAVNDPEKQRRWRL